MAKKGTKTTKKSDRALKRSTPDTNIHEIVNAAMERIEELEARVDALDSGPVVHAVDEEKAAPVVEEPAASATTPVETTPATGTVPQSDEVE